MDSIAIYRMNLRTQKSYYSMNIEQKIECQNVLKSLYTVPFVDVEQLTAV